MESAPVSCAWRLAESDLVSVSSLLCRPLIHKRYVAEGGVIPAENYTFSLLQIPFTHGHRSRMFCDPNLCCCTLGTNNVITIPSRMGYRMPMFRAPAQPLELTSSDLSMVVLPGCSALVTRSVSVQSAMAVFFSCILTSIGRADWRHGHCVLVLGVCLSSNLELVLAHSQSQTDRLLAPCKEGINDLLTPCLYVRGTCVKVIYWVTSLASLQCELHCLTCPDMDRSRKPGEKKLFLALHAG